MSNPNAPFNAVLRFEPRHRPIGPFPPDGHYAVPMTRNALIPVRHIKEWVYPRGNGDAVFKTVRISEHKWYPGAFGFKCSGPDANAVEWPEPPRPIDRAGLIYRRLMTPWTWHPDTGPDTPYLALNEAGINRHDIDTSYPRHNDGLPPDYLEYWQFSGTDTEWEDSYEGV